MKNRIFLWPLALSVILFASFIIIFSPVGRQNLIPVSAPALVPSNSECTSDNDCPANSFCDYSLPGGNGPNGVVFGEPSGSQKCILRCQNDNQCPSHQCRSYEIIIGDIRDSSKGCQP